MSSILSAAAFFSHSVEDVNFQHPLYPISAPRETGFLKVSDEHTLFYALYGNPNGQPVIVLHGGPGCGCSDAMSQSFDLDRWNVIMFDQRGAMRSEPFCCMQENTPQHSINDIEMLRKHLKVEKWVVFGGSWGSALALLYGQAHAKQVLGFILRGVFLIREQDYLHLLYGMGKTFPEVYEPFVNYIPSEERDDLLSAYYRRLFDSDAAVQLKAARLFMRFDLTCSTIYPNPSYLEKMMGDDKLILSIAKAFFHYAKHEFFTQPNQVLLNMPIIDHLPAIIVQGRHDAICLPEMAYALFKNWSCSKLWMVPEGGHTASEQAIAQALAQATDSFIEELNP